ncbi:transcriptional regulator NarP [Mariniflexile rhizosphaerae]|uniref:response regulator n=1 Tax=unclassified Mariniflexile TaxID=2643887 RepID=UPI000CC840D1|nr:response regulator [Mariniflexile sp. TRM1-10]AXP80821.1 transcriptional regulator NarP [Mariniflexile sp. TRM1-10]PLB17662.1 MAG: putative nitrate/nitrite DNA-binding response regulator [Flavobacteriaceae bacterium FS1-H7996/R]
MTTPIKTLIIDDHVPIVEAFERSLSHLNSNSHFVFEVDSATDCDSAILKIEESIKEDKSYHLFFLDISLPPSEDRKFLCGEDVGRRIRELYKNAKIIVFTHHSDSFRISNIFNSINPEGFLIKSEAGFSHFIDAIKNVLNDTPYYTKTVLELLRNNMVSDLVLDEKDRMLLHELSKGTKMKDLPRIINLSMGGIEHRKRNLIEIFNIKKKDDKSLIELAREKGFV